MTAIKKSAMAKSSAAPATIEVCGNCPHVKTLHAESGCTVSSCFCSGYIEPTTPVIDLTGEKWCCDVCGQKSEQPPCVNCGATLGGRYGGKSLRAYQEFVLAVERAKGQDKEWPLINEALEKLRQALAEPVKYQSGLGRRFYLSPDGNFLIWENTSPTSADEAHRGLAYALDNALAAHQALYEALSALLECPYLPHKIINGINETPVWQVEKARAALALADAAQEGEANGG